MDPQELSQRLREGGRLPEAAELVEVRVEPLGDFSNRVSRLHLGWRKASAPGLPGTLICKQRIPGHPARQGESLAREGGLLRELTAHSPLRAPRCWYADEAMLLMEDVARAEPSHFDWQRGPSADHEARAVAELAALHAAWWGRAGELEGLPGFADGPAACALAGGYERAWTRFRRGLTERARPGFERAGDAAVGRVEAVFAGLPAPTLIHGDPHAENLVFEPGPAGGRICFLDWAWAARGSPGCDLALFAAMSLPIAERRRREERIVADHDAALRAAGAGRERDAWRDYRLGLLARLITIVALIRDEAMLAGGFGLVVTRCVVAAADHRVEELIPS